MRQCSRVEYCIVTYGVIVANAKWALTCITCVLLSTILIYAAVDTTAAELHGLFMKKLIDKLAIIGFLLHGLLVFKYLFDWLSRAIEDIASYSMTG